MRAQLVSLSSLPAARCNRLHPVNTSTGSKIDQLDLSLALHFVTVFAASNIAKSFSRTLV